MDSGPALSKFAALTAGPVARLLPSVPSQGWIIAVFRGAIYIGDRATVVCIGARSMEPGPIHVTTSAPASIDWRELGLRPGAAAWISRASIRVGTTLVVPMGGAAHWSPPKWPLPADPAAIASGLGLVRALVAARTDSGVAAHIDPNYRPEHNDHEGRAARESIAGARRWLNGAGTCGLSEAASDLGWSGHLCGLGHGLTPAGDDFLGGIMIALHALGNSRKCDVLWASVRPRAERQTNTISLAFLGAASNGIGSAAIHCAIAGILEGNTDAVRTAMARVCQIGHTSGCDAMAGAATVLDCWLRQRGRNGS